jgi:hypothetical protein
MFIRSILLDPAWGARQAKRFPLGLARWPMASETVQFTDAAPMLFSVRVWLPVALVGVAYSRLAGVAVRRPDVSAKSCTRMRLAGKVPAVVLSVP